MLALILLIRLAVLFQETAKQQEYDLLANQIREHRDKLLAQTDWTQTLDAPVSDEFAKEIRGYRQALRDITEQPSFPYISEYPVMPEVLKSAANSGVVR